MPLTILLSLLKNWRLVGVMGITALLGWQTLQVHNLRATISSDKAERALRAATSEKKGAESAAKATTDLLGDEREDVASNQRVSAIIRNVCMRDADENGVPLPDLGGLDGGRSAAPPHIPIREVLGRAVDHDLRAARSEFNERRRLNQHLQRMRGVCSDGGTGRGR